MGIVTYVGEEALIDLEKADWPNVEAGFFAKLTEHGTGERFSELDATAGNREQIEIREAMDGESASATRDAVDGDPETKAGHSALVETPELAQWRTHYAYKEYGGLCATPDRQRLWVLRNSYDTWRLILILMLS